MRRQAGLRIDHRQAIVVFIGHDAEETKRTQSDVENHVRFSGGSESEDGSDDDSETGNWRAIAPETMTT